jgi:dihydroorotase-like cyclic amidohydrolase
MNNRRDFTVNEIIIMLSEMFDEVLEIQSNNSGIDYHFAMGLEVANKKTSNLIKIICSGTTN